MHHQGTERFLTCQQRFERRKAYDELSMHIPAKLNTHSGLNVNTRSSPHWASVFCTLSVHVKSTQIVFSS